MVQSVQPMAMTSTETASAKTPPQAPMMNKIDYSPMEQRVTATPLTVNYCLKQKQASPQTISMM